jgi:hypothetical protein
VADQAAALPVAVTTPAPAPVASRAGLLAELEAYARRNVAPGADIRPVVDRMLSAITRAVLESQQ